MRSHAFLWASLCVSCTGPHSGVSADSAPSPTPTSLELAVIRDIADVMPTPRIHVIALNQTMRSFFVGKDSAGFVAQWSRNSAPPGVRMFPPLCIDNTALLGAYWKANQSRGRFEATPISIPLSAPGAPEPRAVVGYVLTFSRLGFNRARDSALVELGYGCAGLCGVSTFWLITKQKDRWHPALLITLMDH